MLIRLDLQHGDLEDGGRLDGIKVAVRKDRLMMIIQSRKLRFRHPDQESRVLRTTDHLEKSIGWMVRLHMGILSRWFIGANRVTKEGTSVAQSP